MMFLAFSELITYFKHWVILSLGNTKDLHQSLTPNL